MRTWIIIAAWLVIICAAMGGTTVFLAHQAANQQQYVDYKKVQELLTHSKSAEAVEILNLYVNTLSANKPEGLDWLPITVEALKREKDVGGLLVLYQQFPRGFDNNEEASLIVAGTLLAHKKTDDYGKLREKWNTHTHRESAWFVLDADKMLVEGKNTKALQFLQSRTFNGAEDTGRLIRLALLEAKNNLGAAWNLLSEALAKDPTNSDVTTYRAQLLEAIQKPTLARIEYLSAIQKDPRNPTLILQLGEFYRRNNHFALAIDAWSQGLELPHSDELWLKTLFWSRVTSPLRVLPQAKPPQTGPVAPLIAYLYNLPAGQFWNQAAFEKIPEHQVYLKHSQETFWLRLADALLRNDESQAAELLDFNTFHATSWAPELQRSLQEILAYRRYGILHIDEVGSPNGMNAQNKTATVDETEHQFFQLLEKLAQEAPAGLPAENVPDEMRTLLTGDYAFPATFLAAGWFEAALAFPLPTALPEGLPNWVAFAYTQALRYNSGPIDALNFAIKQKANPALNLLIGELMITTGSPDSGIRVLKPLTLQRDDVGMRAAWLISLVQIDRQQYDLAKYTVEHQPLLADNIIGKEALARIALKQGDVKQADLLYSGIVNDSLEAKLYLARRASASQKWNTALKLTEQLVIEFPENLELRRDLNKLRERVGPDLGNTQTKD